MSEEITKEDLMSMKLHEEKELRKGLVVIRVFGGWIYTTYILDLSADIPVSASQCFVPEVINVQGDITQHF